MIWEEALQAMKEGHRVRLPEWVGYWFIKNNTILIHCSEGTVIDIRDTKEPLITVEFMTRDDWEIADDLNKSHNLAYMDFGEALKHLKCGNKLTRKGWNGHGMFVVYQKGYPDGIPCNKQTAEAWGMEEGDLFICNPYLQIKNVNGSHSMWVPSINDVLATDWRLHTDGSKMS